MFCNLEVSFDQFRMGCILHQGHGSLHQDPIQVEELGPLTDSHHRHENLNVRAAFVHVMGDLIQSVGVLLAAALIWWKPEWQVADPICTFFFSILVVASTWMIVRDSIHVLMEGTPSWVNSSHLHQSLLQVPGVMAVHDLHIWSLSPGKAAATAHVVADDNVLADEGKATSYRNLLLGCQQAACQYQIHHFTVQVDLPSDQQLHCLYNCGTPNLID